MEDSSLTNEDIDAALQLIQLVFSSDFRRNASEGVGRWRNLKLEEESEGESNAYMNSSPVSIEEVVERENGSCGQRKRKLLSARAQNRRIENDKNAAQQLLQLSEEGESCNTGDKSYITGASSSAAMEARLDLERGGGGGSQSDKRGLCSVVMKEDDSMEQCLADFCRRKKKFLSLIDLYSTTKPLL